MDELMTAKTYQTFSMDNKKNVHRNQYLATTKESKKKKESG